ncbi:hypothetical protein GCM10011519_03380 [Marmoricola endophyticus]|uniref:Peptide methionine sulfoxide reductase n=1 Tax=Marmoricola endophyticus TaxID=2040280 RepID=A0A917B9M9_9ACTN|nr:peptide methionine sulfoxide reductase [Marmoricola endophyticus]GGF33245.1 hypothetical protein GCM10011519_03380 [Marmoricola endophyticus]
MAEPLLDLLARVPTGWSAVRFAGARWGLRRTEAAGGRSVAVYAEELGGSGVVSANVYLTDAGAVLRPCEMPAERVLSFLRGWVPLEGPESRIG